MGSRLNELAENDDWAGTPLLSAAFTATGAWPLATSSSKDSALLVTLQPGAYTAQVSGAGGSTGIALVEIFELQQDLRARLEFSNSA